MENTRPGRKQRGFRLISQMTRFLAASSIYPFFDSDGVPYYGAV
jgi:hypothetical protein